MSVNEVFELVIIEGVIIKFVFLESNVMKNIDVV